VALNRPLYLSATGGDATFSYSAQDDRTLIDALVFGSGVSWNNDLAVSQRAAGANFSVDVAAGHCVIPGTSVADQGKYVCQNTATLNVVITGAPGSGTRYDLIYAQVRDKAADGGSNYDFTIASLTGTVGSGLPATPANAIPLAQVGPIVSSTASITSALITNLRPQFSPAGFRARSADVATQQTTTSTSYTNLATVGPAVTLPLFAGQQVMVTIAARMQNSVGAGFAAVMSWDISGAVTRAAQDVDSIEQNDNVGSTLQLSALYTATVTGLYVFTSKYKVLGACTGTFLERRMIVSAA
jgi:hypothetical protein